MNKIQSEANKKIDNWFGAIIELAIYVFTQNTSIIFVDISIINPLILLKYKQLHIHVYLYTNCKL